MITCDKCKTVNPPDQRFCSNCRRDLLPGTDFLVRVIVFLFMLVLAGGSAWIVWKIATAQELPEFGCLFTSPVWWGLLALLLPIFGFIYLVKRTPDYERYADRAKRHLLLDNQQALSDFNEAVRLAPEKGRAPILRERAKLLETLGNDQEALRDRIAVAEDPSAHDGSAVLNEMIGGDKDTFLRGMQKADRETLVKSGAVSLGYCPGCNKTVELNEKSKCPLHPHRTIQFVRLAIPAEVEKVKVEIADKRRKERRSILVGWIGLILVVVILCLVLKYVIGT